MLEEDVLHPMQKGLSFRNRSCSFILLMVCQEVFLYIYYPFQLFLRYNYKIPNVVAVKGECLSGENKIFFIEGGGEI